MKTIGKYQLQQFLGRGTWSVVFKVAHPLTGKVVALKLLQPNPVLAELLGMETMKELFKREARILGQLNHPNVLTVWDFDYWRNKPFFIMEFFKTSLKDIIGGGHEITRVIRVEQAVQYTLDILGVLQYLHEAGIIHRDIKPDNILFTEHGIIKIADFGLVHMDSSPLKGILPPNIIIGSGEYAAPEQLAKKKVVPQTDIYSVGILFYKMLTGRFPRQGGELSNMNPDYDQNWDRFIKKALAPDPAQRFTSAMEMQEFLTKLYPSSQEKTRSIKA